MDGDNYNYHKVINYNINLKVII